MRWNASLTPPRYQMTLDNQLYQALRALREAQESRQSRE
jgi:hypothetical protein